MLTSASFPLLNWGYILWISLKRSITFRQSSTSTGYLSNSTGSYVTNCRFSPIIDLPSLEFSSKHADEKIHTKFFNLEIRVDHFKFYYNNNNNSVGNWELVWSAPIRRNNVLLLSEPKHFFLSHSNWWVLIIFPNILEICENVLKEPWHIIFQIFNTNYCI